MRVAEPLEPEAVPDLLVRGGDEDEVAGGPKPSRARDAIATALAATWPFMSSAPRPQTLAVDELAGPGSRAHSAGSATPCRYAEEARATGRRPPSRRATRLARSGSALELALDPVRAR